ncbi:hypothetical protein BD779DRAFT_1611821 [Infundibulicybe gibba]|nr:hypothetical protein BD779DRAFT_1611821 [Infundibulicybe gibba]
MPPYTGTQRKLVLAFDLGTTFSGISYRYPGQEHAGGDSKIPTVLYYDMNGQVCAAGAAATCDEIKDKAFEKGWRKAEWFKMHMCPNNSAARHDLPPLPPNKTVVDVMGDYMRYLRDCAEKYIQGTHGASLWLSLENNMDFVLSHPNGWEGAQQEQMRRAAILGGLVSNQRDAGTRIRFVTEGEASLHFCIRNGLFVQSGTGVLVVDAGGGTIDLSAYSKESNSQFEEIAPPQCHMMGSIFVTQNARTFIRELLEESKYTDDVDHIAECFDKSTKLRFKDANEPAFIKFGSHRDRDTDLGIRAGQLQLKGADIASFFDPSVQCIIQAIADMRRVAFKPISCVFLVGGFGTSDYLFSKLKHSLGKLQLDFCRPDTYLNKAVADGAISFYIDHFVSVRVSRRIYGCFCNIQYNPDDAEHVRRASKKFVNLASGHTLLPGNEQVSEKKEFRNSYIRYFERPPPHIAISIRVLCYQGYNSSPQWGDVDSDNYSVFCTVTATIPNICAVNQMAPRTWKKYYSLSFDVILAFGLTELQAQVAWKENFCRGPAQIMYNDI